MDRAHPLACQCCGQSPSAGEVEIYFGRKTIVLCHRCIQAHGRRNRPCRKVRGEPGDNYNTSSTVNKGSILPGNHTLGTSGVSPVPRLSPDPLFALPSVGGQNPKGADSVPEVAQDRGGRPRVGDDVVRRVLALRAQGCGYKMTAAVLGAQGVKVSPRTVGRLISRWLSAGCPVITPQAPPPSERSQGTVSHQEDDGDA